MEGGGERRIKLSCPSLSKVIEMVAVDDQKLDLGSIARAFGLDPHTLKLNGYFIGRGPDHIASSLTWKSLIAFFSARGLPTGAATSAALLVDGKLSKIGSKRSREVEDAANVGDNTREREIGCFRDSKRQQHDHCSSIACNQNQLWLVFQSRILFRDDDLSYMVGLQESSGLSPKRKWWLEDESRLKRTRFDEEDGFRSVLS